MKQEDIALLQQIPAPLLRWYATHKRDLPWRKNATPYHVWVSEIMLQQTRVEAVIEYYNRFISALPTVYDLADCEEEKLLKLWEGLGYYNRVRNMQKTAKTIAYSLNGEFPQDVASLQDLKGIGRYTAGAISSIAFGKPVSAVDGNVLRVVARLLENPTPINDTNYRKQLDDVLSSIYPKAKKDCANFTQSLFELGATVCKPKGVDCTLCPLAGICLSYKNNTQHLYPVRPKQREKRREEVYVFLLQTPQGFCITRRNEGVLKGMNAFPSFIINNGESVDLALSSFGIYDYQIIRQGNFEHIFTHIQWDIICLYIQTESAPFDCYTLSEIQENLSIPTAFKQCLKLL